MLRRFLLVLLASAALIGSAAYGKAAGTLGIVLLHGKDGMPNQLEGLAAALHNAGYLVEAPQMCWSRRRNYDRPFHDCIAEIDGAVGRLVAGGAGRIAVVGMSLGGSAALAYGALHPNLAGIVALGPGPQPDRLVHRPEIAQSVAQAQALVAAGRGDEKQPFADSNVGRLFSTTTTAAIYLSFFAPGGPANMTENTERLRVPLLWVSGTADPTQTGTREIFSRAPVNPYSRYVEVNSDHLGTPNAAAEAVLAWLAGLR